MPIAGLVLPKDVAVSIRQNVVGSILGGRGSPPFLRRRPLGQAILVLRPVVNVVAAAVNVPVPVPTANVDVAGVDVDVGLAVTAVDIGACIGPPVTAWSPPASPITSAEAEGEAEGTVAEADSEAPTGPRVVADMHSPGPGSGIVIAVVPGE